MSASILSLEGPQRLPTLGRGHVYHMACMQNSVPPRSMFRSTVLRTSSAKWGARTRPFRRLCRSRTRRKAWWSITPPLDMFVDSNLLIYGEVPAEVAHHLMSKADWRGDIKRIYSHPMPSRNAEIGWNELAARAGVRSGQYRAAAEMSVDDPSAAAIASELASQLYGLKVVTARIEDNINNFTRFWCCQKAPERTGRTKHR